METGIGEDLKVVITESGIGRASAYISLCHFHGILMKLLVVHCQVKHEILFLVGFDTALVEKFDYSSGTSSRSTKLIHGGVRYLQKAVFNLDYGQYRLVKEALHERANLLKIAPHLSHPLPIMLPVYK